MENLKSVRAVTFILCGSMVYQFNSLAGGWTAGMASLFGFILMLLGLNMLKMDLDYAGQSGAKVMFWGALVGGIASVFDLIPVVGFFASFGYLVAFVLIVIGLFKLRSSPSVGRIGKEGIAQILVAYVVAIAGVLISLIPVVGGIVASFFALVAMLLNLTGWLKFQKGLAEPSSGFAAEPVTNTPLG